ncbi:MAG: hypothetical protein ABI422_03165 [Sphingomicrobium sp.]
MACKQFVVALGMIVAASPLAAAQPQPTPWGGAPAAPADARYCLRVAPITGSRLETVACETRDGWAQLEVDVDKEWAEEGVRVIA